MTSLAFFGLTVHLLLTPIGILGNLTMLGERKVVDKYTLKPGDGNGTMGNVGIFIGTFVNYMPKVGQKDYVLYRTNLTENLIALYVF